MTAAELSAALTDRITELVRDLLPGGHREGHEWRCGNTRGEAGSSLAVHLTGDKSGVWCDFATGESGDALDLVKAVLGVDMVEAVKWARRWLGIGDGKAELPRRPAPKKIDDRPEPDCDRWRYPWQAARPIGGTLAATYLAGRKLWFDDPDGRVLRYAARRARKSPDGALERHPALLALLSNVRTGEPCGLINVYLLAGGSGRIRDAKGKTVTGHAKNAAVMLSGFDEVTMGLVTCEGPETGIALHQKEMRPVWACGGAGNLKWFPLLGGIECLTIAADPDAEGQEAAAAVASRWRNAGREAFIITPPVGDWATEQ